MTRHVLSGLTACLVLTCALGAQPPAGKGPPDKKKGGPKKKGLKLVEEPRLLKLLVQESLQNDLGLTESQRTTVAAIAEQYRAWAEDPTGGVDPATLPPRERNQLRKKLRDAESRLLDRLDRALTSPQWRRLRQIELQIRGVDILGDAVIAKELVLSDRQRREIGRIRGLADDAVDKLRQDIRGRIKGPEAKLLLEQAQRTSHGEIAGRIQAILTSSQQAALRRLLGKPFDVSSLKGLKKGPKRAKLPKPKLQKDI